MPPSHGHGQGLREGMFSFFSFPQELSEFLVLPWAKVNASSVIKPLCNSERGAGENQIPQSLSVLAKSQGITLTGRLGTGNSLDHLLAQVYQSVISGEGRSRGGPTVLPSAPLELDSISLFTQGRLLSLAAANLRAEAGIPEMPQMLSWPPKWFTTTYGNILAKPIAIWQSTGIYKSCTNFHAIYSCSAVFSSYLSFTGFPCRSPWPCPQRLTLQLRQRLILTYPLRLCDAAPSPPSCSQESVVN